MILATSDVKAFGDIFKKSFLKLLPNTLNPSALLLTMLISLLVGVGIFVIYRKCFTGVVYDHSFNMSLVVMTVLTAVIIVTISANVTLSLGMVGALSIVRYRTAVKNPLDLMFLFWAITSGIAIGAQYYYIGIMAFVFVTLVFAVLYQLKGGNTTYVLVVNYTSSMELEEEIRRAMGDYKIKLRSKIVKNETTELTLEVYLKAENMNITNKLTCLEGVHDVTLVQYRGVHEL